MWILTRYRCCNSVVALALTAVVTVLSSTVRGQGSYSALEVSYHVRSLSMSGVGVADEKGMDISAINPALLLQNSKALLFSVLRYPADIQSEMMEFRNPWGAWNGSLTIRHMGYGRFKERDDDGRETGEFSAGDVWFSAAFARSLFPSLDVGIMAGLYYSQIEKVTGSLGILTLGTVLKIPEYGAALGLSVRNLGVTLQSYTGNPEAIPTSVNAGITKKMAYLPLELSVDGVWWKEGGLVRIGGEFSLRHGFLLRWGTSTYRFDQKTNQLWRDVFTGSSLGVGYQKKNLIIDMGLRYTGVAGTVMGVGVSIAL